jgi:hypothetical protein
MAESLASAAAETSSSEKVSASSEPFDRVKILKREAGAPARRRLLTAIANNS